MPTKIKPPKEVKELEAAGHKLVRHDDYASWARWEFATGIKETDGKIVAHSVMITYEPWAPTGCPKVRVSNHTETCQKFLCVNGPLAGKKRTEDAAGDGYYLYNRASSGRVRGDGKPPKCVLVAL